MNVLVVVRNNDEPVDTDDLWWSTASNGASSSTSTNTDGSSTTLGGPGSTSPTAAGSSSTLTTVTTTFTTSFPVSTFVDPSTTLTSFSQSVVTSTLTTALSPSDSSPMSGSASSPSSPGGSSSSTSSSSSSRTFPTDPAQAVSSQLAPVCIGNGLDASADGIIATIVFPTAIGLLIWLLFAILRPRFRQIYALREWFVQQDLRPKPLTSSFLSFLSPPVPLVPSLPSSSDLSDSASSTSTSNPNNPNHNSSSNNNPASQNNDLFPSDEQLSQRSLWIALMIVLGWSILAVAAFLPLYLVETPCLGDVMVDGGTFSGAYSTLQDLSLIRLLNLIDSERSPSSSSSSSSQQRRSLPSNHNNTTHTLLSTLAISDSPSTSTSTHTRIIILTTLTILLALLPALYKLMKEFNKLVAYRRHWIEVKCEGQEMGWLSAERATGFGGWGEKRLKGFLMGVGLSSCLESSNGNGGGGAGAGGVRRRGTGVSGRGLAIYGGDEERERDIISPGEEAKLQVDIKALFTIGDTTRLSHLIDERDEILENLEIAETQYISSFRITTPDPSIADMDLLSVRGGGGGAGSSRGGGGDDSQAGAGAGSRMAISRPLPLSKSRSRKRTINPAFAASSLTPTSFVAPSQYYKLRSPRGVSGGKFANESTLHIHSPGRGGGSSSHPRLKNAGGGHSRTRSGSNYASRERDREEPPSFSSTIHSRIVGSRFQEINQRDSMMMAGVGGMGMGYGYGPGGAAGGGLPIGAHVGVNDQGELGPIPMTFSPTTMSPGHTLFGSGATGTTGTGTGTGTGTARGFGSHFGGTSSGTPMGTPRGEEYGYGEPEGYVSGTAEGEGEGEGEGEEYDTEGIPDPRRFGPNYDQDRALGLDEEDEAGLGEEGSDWVDVQREKYSEGDTGDTETEVMGSDWNGGPPSAFARRVKPLIPGLRRGESGVGSTSASEKRETFPMRSRGLFFGAGAGAGSGAGGGGGKGGRGGKGGSGMEVDDELLPPHMRLQPSQPFVRPMTGINYTLLGEVYSSIRHWRSKLKKINVDIAEAQRESYGELAEGQNVRGWIMVGRGLRFLEGVEIIEGRAKEDVRWDMLQWKRTGGKGWVDDVVLWCVVGIVGVLLAAALTATLGLALADAPNVTSSYLPFLRRISEHDDLWSGVVTTLVPAIAAIVFITAAMWVVHWAANIRGTISISAGQLLLFKLTFFVLCTMAIIIIVCIGALLFSVPVFSNSASSAGGGGGLGRPESVANGSIYMSVLAFSIVITMAFVVPGLLMLQPRRLWRVVRAEKRAITPRQRFRAVYPRTYDPSFAIGACLLAIVFASTFAVIFPLMGPAVCLLLLLTLVAHRYLIGYVYARTHSQTGGLLQIWLLKRFGTIITFQPILLGLVLLSRRFWIEGGVLLGTAFLVIVFVEVYTTYKMGRIQEGRGALSNITLDSLGRFEGVMRRKQGDEDGDGDEEDEYGGVGRTTPGGGSALSLGGGRGRVGQRQRARSRGSMASVLEMMSLTLAVMPSPSRTRGPVPLQTETLDDLTATERAARTHPDAPPHLPPLPFTDHAEEMAGILYAPELIAPPPIIWLPNDSAGVARSEAVDLQKYHDLRVTLDVRSKEDVLKREKVGVRRPVSM